MVITVCAPQATHPNAIDTVAEIPNIEKAFSTATGYPPVPPLVAATLKAPAIKPIKIAAKGIVSKLLKANVVV